MLLARLEDIKEHMNLKNVKRIADLLEKGILPNITTGNQKKTFHTSKELLQCVETLFENSSLKNEFGTFQTFLQKNNLNHISELSRSNSLATVYSIANNKGGVSKTFTSITLCWILAKLLGYRVLLVDMDNQANASHYFLNDECEEYAEMEMQDDFDGYFQDKNIAVLFDQINRNNNKTKNITKKDVQDNIFTFQEIATAFNSKYFEEIGESAKYIKFDILPSNLSLGVSLAMSRNQKMSHKQLDSILSQVKDEYDFIFIDTPPALDNALDMSIYASDKVILSSHPTSRSRQGIKNIISSLAALKRDIEKDIELDALIINSFNKVNVHTKFLDKMIKIAIENGISTKKIKKIEYKTIVQDTESERIIVLESKKKPTHALDLVAPLFEYCNEIIKDKGVQNV